MELVGDAPCSSLCVRRRPPPTAATRARALAAPARPLDRRSPPAQASGGGGGVASRVSHGVVQRVGQRGGIALSVSQRDGHVVAVPGHALLRSGLRRAQPAHVHLRVPLAVANAQRRRVCHPVGDGDGGRHRLGHGERPSRVHHIAERDDFRLRIAAAVGVSVW